MKATLKNLDEIKASQNKKRNWIKVGVSSCGIAAGALEVIKVLKEEAQKNQLDITIDQCGCAGMCYAEPLVEVSVEGMMHTLYGEVNKDIAVEIITKHVMGHKLIEDHIFKIKAE